jgi:hypothetical protein
MLAMILNPYPMIISHFFLITNKNKVIYALFMSIWRKRSGNIALRPKARSHYAAASLHDPCLAVDNCQAEAVVAFAAHRLKGCSQIRLALII